MARQYSGFRRTRATPGSGRFQATPGRIWGSFVCATSNSGGHVHKLIGAFVVLVLGLAMLGCGNGSSSTNINGNWSASLTGSPTGPTIYAFTTTFAEASGGGLSITNFTFTSAGSCFTGQTTESGSFTLSGDFSGNVTGTFGMTITGSGNTLMLQGGVANNNTITGTWSLTGSTGCTGNGFFTITRT